MLTSRAQNTLYFEARKHTDLYMWASKTPNGPSAKLHVQNIHTMDELKMTGNCLKGSRHLLSFDKAFDDVPHWGIMKELLGQVSVAAEGQRGIRRCAGRCRAAGCRSDGRGTSAERQSVSEMLSVAAMDWSRL